MKGQGGFMARRLGWALLFVMMLGQSAQAQYYTFTENTRQTQLNSFETIMQTAASNAVELLNWAFHQNKRPQPTEKYNRQRHFGSWIEETQDQDCFDVRAEVLIRDSKAQVKLNPNNPCKVAAGKWYDPYSGQIITQASDIEIDHVVALKNAYDSGAWSWKQNLRCLYGNFMGYNNHLLSVSSGENQRKSDKSPEAWMPSDSRYACDHLKNWLTVKYVWNLNMSQSEALAIAQLIKQYRCDMRMFQPTKSEIAKIRRYATANINLCDE